MNQPSESPDAHEDSWEVLAGYLEAFLEQWEADGFGPQLSEHLPCDSDPLRRMVLIELIKVDLEYRHDSDGPVLRLEDYLAEYPELGESDGSHSVESRLESQTIHEYYPHLYPISIYLRGRLFI